MDKREAVDRAFNNLNVELTRAKTTLELAHVQFKDKSIINREKGRLKIEIQVQRT